MKPVALFQWNAHKSNTLVALLACTMLLNSGTAYGAPATGPIDPRTVSKEGLILPKDLGERIKDAKFVPEGSNPINKVPTFEIPKTPDAIEKVTKLENDGENWFQRRQLDKALASWQEAYGLSIEMKYTEGQGRALTNMCRIYIERNENIKAKYMGENAVEVLADSQDKKSLGKARVQLARAYFQSGNPIWAGAQLDEALKLLTSSDSTSNSAEAADALMLAGSILVKIKKLKEALQFYEAAANYFAQSGDHNRAISTRITIASFMDEYGYYMAALEESNKALSVARAVPEDKPSTIAALASLGMAQYNLCEYANARKTYEEALRLLQQVKFTDVPIGPRAYIDLGYGCSLAATGDFDMARIVLERTIQPLKQAGSTHGQAQAFDAMGILEELQGQHGKAITYLQQALDLQNVITPKQPKLNLVILQNLAAAESRSGDNRSAKMHLELAMGLFKQFPSTMLKARTYSSLAEVCMKLSDPQRASEYLKEAMALGERVEDDASLWRDYTLLAKMQLTDGLTAEAKDSLASALSHFRSPQAGAFPTPERLGFPSSREDLGEQLVAMVAKIGSGEQALLTAEQLKEETFNNEWHRRGGQVRPDDKDIYTDLTILRAHLHAAEAADDPKAMLKDWKDWLGRFRALIAENRPLARLVAPVPNTVQDILKGVKKNQCTVLEYLVGADSCVAFTVEPSGRITATVLPVTRKQLQSQVTALLATYTTTNPDNSAAKANLQALHNELLPAGLKGYLPKTPEQTIAIIPDGVLFNLPFAALVDQQGRFLVEGHTLTLASSIALFIDSPPKYSEEFSLLVASAASSPGEASMISHSVPSQQVTDIGALQEQGRGKSVVHFASNLPMSSNPLSVFVPLSSKEDAGKRVTASRLFATTMNNDLVVLSGTSINAKDVQGSAVKLFSRGLNYAGARNVLMSLWLAPDPERTRELVEFYKNEQSGMNQAQSWRKAQLLSLSRDPSPRSWAAFQMLGPGF